MDARENSVENKDSGQVQDDHRERPADAQGDSTVIASASDTSQDRSLADLVSDPGPGHAPPRNDSSAVLQPGQQIGPFQVVRQLGAGGMGEVYEASDTRLRRRVAIKIPKTQSQEEAARKRFLKEARSCAALHHPGICSIFDVGEFAGRPYLCIQFIEGKSLHELIRSNGPLTDGAAAVLIAQVAEALAHAHDRGILHRDLKPANIMIAADGAPVVMDFGLAGSLEPAADETRLTQPGMLIGTPAYMSPEQADGDPERLVCQSDIYSLGAVLYHILTGRPPFMGSVTQILHQIATARPIPPQQIIPALDHELNSFCMRMLSQNPLQRPGSMSAVAREAKSIAVRLRQGTNAQTMFEVPAVSPAPAMFPLSTGTVSSPKHATTSVTSDVRKPRRWLSPGVLLISSISTGILVTFVILVQSGGQVARIQVDNPNHRLLIDGRHESVVNGIATVSLSPGTHFLQLMEDDRLVRTRRLVVPDDVRDPVTFSDDPAESGRQETKLHSGNGPFSGYDAQDYHPQAPGVIQVPFRKMDPSKDHPEWTFYEALPGQQHFEMIGDRNGFYTGASLRTLWYLDGDRGQFNPEQQLQFTEPAASGMTVAVNLPPGTHNIGAYSAGVKSVMIKDSDQAGERRLEQFSPLYHHSHFAFYAHPNLTYDGLTISGNRLHVRESLTVHMDIWNCGTVAGKPGVVRFYFNPNLSSVQSGLILERSYESIEAGGRSPLSFVFPLHPSVRPGQYVLTISVDATDTTVERDELGSIKGLNENAAFVHPRDPHGLPPHNNICGIRLSVE